MDEIIDEPSPWEDLATVMSPERRAVVAKDALARLQDVAQAQGKMRVSWTRQQRRFASGATQDAAVSDTTDTPLDPHVPPELQAYEAHTRTTGSAWVATPGMATTRTRYRQSNSLGAVLGSVVRHQGWDHSTKMGSVMVKWPDIVGVDVAAHCVVESFEDKRLIIRCDSTAWMNQMKLLLPAIERRIDEEVGPGVVTQTIIRGPHVPSWKHGQWSVQGRGPRDTYG